MAESLEDVQVKIVEYEAKLKEEKDQGLLLQLLVQLRNKENHLRGQQTGRGSPQDLSTFERMSGRVLSAAEKLKVLESSAMRTAMQQGVLTEELVRLFLRKLKAQVGTVTAKAAVRVQGYVFDGIMARGGQPTSSVYTVFWHEQPRCAKVHTPSAHTNPSSVVQQFEREQTVAAAVHGSFVCPTLVQVLASFECTSHLVLVMPLLGQPLSALVKHATDRHFQVSDRTVAVVCMCTLAAVAALSQLGWCHGDIKPDNIMLSGQEGLAVLIDLASSTRYGEPLTECTEVYSLGLTRVGSLQWDLTCLAATLYQLAAPAAGARVLAASTASVRLIQELESCEHELSLGDKLVLAILQACEAPIEADQLHASVWQPCLQLVTEALGPATAVLNAPWPVPKTQE